MPNIIIKDGCLELLGDKRLAVNLIFSREPTNDFEVLPKSLQIFNSFAILVRSIRQWNKREFKILEIPVLQSLLSAKAVVQRLNHLEQSLYGRRYSETTLDEVFTVFRYIIFNKMLQPLPHLIK